VKLEDLTKRGTPCYNRLSYVVRVQNSRRLKWSGCVSRMGKQQTILNNIGGGGEVI